MPPSFQTVRLEAGSHRGPEDGVCVMELASMLAGEPFSDHPRSVSKALAMLLRGYNDAVDDARRQALMPYASACVGSALGRPVDRRRRRLVRRWLTEVRGTSGLRAALARRWSVVDLTAIGTEMGLRVRRQDDSKLHARVLGLLDALLDVGAAAAPIAVAPEIHDREPVIR
jgi:hypothetical protein